MVFSALMDVNNGVIHIDLEGVHTNIVSVEIVKPGLSAADFCKRIAMVSDAESYGHIKMILAFFSDFLLKTLVLIKLDCWTSNQTYSKRKVL